MAGIYIHIPFCRKACHYCNFHFSTSLQQKDDFFSALLHEIALQKGYLEEQEINTLYFGGGTPSLMSTAELEQVMDALNRHFNIHPNAEITFETNPDDIAAEKLSDWKKNGINRLSIGIQSFRDEDLRWMNRAHDAQQTTEAVSLAQQSGFENITIDLIYGVPGMDDDAWKKNIQTAIGLGIPHLSCYALTVEPGTALEKMIGQHKKEPADAALAATHFDILVAAATAAGFEQYEISNFAQPGYRSRHNTAYWKGIHYLGLGPSAHSFNGVSRQWNVANNMKYIRSLSKGIVPFEQETLTVTQRLNEYIMTSLRTIEGMDMLFIKKEFGATETDRILAQAQTYILRGTMEYHAPVLSLTREGLFFADGIAADLFAT
jgi:oxygen-independent coproporphyrinogen III oxidase